MGKKRAKEHYDFIRKQYHKEIDNSIANTTIHACESIAEEHGVQTLILGAWGCGVFEWNPETVAELFMEVKGRYIIFAIPGLFEYNYMVFNRVLS